MRNYAVMTSRGRVSISAPDQDSARPVLFLLHGAFRGAASLKPFANLLPEFDVVYGHLPGHSGAAVWEDPTIDAMGRAFAEALAIPPLKGREFVLVGESVGAVVAIAAAGHVTPGLRAAVAFEPFLSTSKLWMMATALEGAKSIGYPQPEKLGESVFGLLSATDRNYATLLSKVTAPLHVVTGDLPLHPKREMRETPSLVDDEDRRVLREAGATVHTLPGGHRLLDDSPQACAQIVRLLAEPAHGDDAVLEADRAG